MDLVGLADLHVALALDLHMPRQGKLEKKETENDMCGSGKQVKNFTEMLRQSCST